MDDFTQMHAFFAVTTAAVILVTALVCATLVALVRFLRTLDRIANHVEEETQEIREDLDDLREDLHNGFRLVPFFRFFGSSARAVLRRSACVRGNPRAPNYLHSFHILTWHPRNRVRRRPRSR